MLELAQQIQANSQLVTDYLKQNRLPLPSLAADAYPFFPGTGPPEVDIFPRLNDDVRNARAQLRVAAAHLLQLAAGPAEAAFSFMTGHFSSACLQYIYHFGLAEHIPVDSDISYKELAARAGVDPNQCA